MWQKFVRFSFGVATVAFAGFLRFFGYKTDSRLVKLWWKFLVPLGFYSASPRLFLQNFEVFFFLATRHIGKVVSFNLGFVSC